MNDVNSAYLVSRGLYPGSENKYDGVFGQATQAIDTLDGAANTVYSGTAYEIEGTDTGDLNSASMYQALNLRNGGMSPQQMMAFVQATDDSMFNTDVTSPEALARSARFADQIGDL